MIITRIVAMESLYREKSTLYGPNVICTWKTMKKGKKGKKEKKEKKGKGGGEEEIDCNRRKIVYVSVLRWAHIHTHTSRHSPFHPS